MARSNNNDCAEVYFQHGSCSIILKQGDLLDETDVDVIVIPTPEYGQQASHSYPIFDAFCSKADRRLREEINKFSSKIRSGGEPQIIWDNKPLIILTPTPYCGNEKKAFQLLKDTYLACLKLAVNQNSRTIAFPTIGCGQSGFKPGDAAHNLYKALSQFEQSRDKKLNEIRIIIYNKDIFSEFINVFMELGQDRNAKLKLIDMYVSFCLINRASLLFALFIFLNFVSFLFHVLDHRKTQIHVKCHRKETKNKHHDNSHETTKQRSND